MVRGKAESQWQQTASILAMLANANRDTKKTPKPFTADDFNPFSETKPAGPILITTENRHLLRDHFVPLETGA